MGCATRFWWLNLLSRNCILLQCKIIFFNIQYIPISGTPACQMGTGGGWAYRRWGTGCLGTTESNHWTGRCKDCERKWSNTINVFSVIILRYHDHYLTALCIWLRTVVIMPCPKTPSRSPATPLNGDRMLWRERLSRGGSFALIWVVTRRSGFPTALNTD